jgi:hypothetical protein
MSVINLESNVISVTVLMLYSKYKKISQEKEKPYLSRK